MDDFELTTIKAIKKELCDTLSKVTFLDDFPNFMKMQYSMTNAPDKQSDQIDNFFQNICSYDVYDKCQQIVGEVKALRTMYRDMLGNDKNYNAFKGMHRCAIFEWLNDQLYELDKQVNYFKFHEFSYDKLEYAISRSFPEKSVSQEFGYIRHEWYRVNAYVNMMMSIIQYAAFEVINALYECVDVKVSEPAYTSNGFKVYYYDECDAMTIQQWMLDEARK